MCLCVVGDLYVIVYYRFVCVFEHVYVAEVILLGAFPAEGRHQKSKSESSMCVLLGFRRKRQDPGPGPAHGPGPWALAHGTSTWPIKCLETPARIWKHLQGVWKRLQGVWKRLLLLINC